MVEMFYNIWNQMILGNFSFLILIFAIAQTILMIINMKANKDTRNILNKRKNEN